MSVEKQHMALFRKWRDRLGLSDWRFLFSDNCEPDELVVKECSGCTEWEESTKTARVQILDPKYYGNRVVPFDFEEILVHELLHVKMCFLTDSDDALQNRIGHQLIDDLARAFVEAQRDNSIRKDDDCAK